MKKIFYLASIALAALMIGCKDGPETDQPNNPSEPETTTLSIEPNALTIAKTAGASATATITSNSDVLSVEVDFAAASWLSASLEGTTLTVSAKSANTDTKSRQGIVTVYAGEGANTATEYVTVTQSEETDIAPTIELATTTAVLSHKEGTVFPVTVTSNVTNITATVTEGAEWLKAEVAEGSVVLTTLSVNTASEARTGSVKVTATNTNTNESIDATIAVTQEAFLAGAQIGDAVQGGIVFWVSEDGTKGKVLYPYAEIKKHSADKTWDIPGATNVMVGEGEEAINITKFDGTQNVAALKQFASDNNLHFADAFPAAAYCDALPGGGWYLPSQNELINLFEAYNGTPSGEASKQTPNLIKDTEKAARASFDAALLKAFPDGQILNTGAETGNGDSAFASNFKEKGKAFVVRFGKYVCDAYDPTGTTRYARCIKVVEF